MSIRIKGPELTQVATQAQQYECICSIMFLCIPPLVSCGLGSSTSAILRGFRSFTIQFSEQMAMDLGRPLKPTGPSADGIKQVEAFYKHIWTY